MANCQVAAASRMAKHFTKIFSFNDVTQRETFLSEILKTPSAKNFCIYFLVKFQDFCLFVLTFFESSINGKCIFNYALQQSLQYI